MIEVHHKMRQQLQMKKKTHQSNNSASLLLNIAIRSNKASNEINGYE
jgi:hypothetical protein